MPTHPSPPTPPPDAVQDAAGAAWATAWALPDVAWGAPAWRWRQQARLARLLDVAAARSPLYRQLLGHTAAPAERWTRLPTMTKAELMARFDQWVTDPALRIDGVRQFIADTSRVGQPYLGRYTVWTSSGSSGQPGVFVQDAKAMAVYDALEACRGPWLAHCARHGRAWWLGERTAFVGALDGHFASVVVHHRMRRTYPAFGARTEAISFLQPVDQVVDALNRLDPAVLVTYPSMALALAQQRRAGRLRVRLDAVWTGGETLTPSVRATVSDAFACRVVDSYGASEFFTLASECAHGRLHVNSDWALLEPVDALGRPTPAGDLSHTVLLTNLANEVQPLIRYDLGDRVRLPAERCECGSALPLIEVQGRQDDALCLRGQHGGLVRLVPLAVSTVVEEGAGLFDFQLEQLAPDRLSLHTPLLGADALAALHRARAALAGFLQAQGVGGVHIRVRSGVAPRRGPGGKVQRVLLAPAAAQWA